MSDAKGPPNPNPKPKPKRKAEAIAVNRDKTRQKINAASAADRDVGALPPIKDPIRRANAGKDFGLFCRTYFPDLFFMDWSEPHKTAIQTMETVVAQGGTFALAMPRSYGKTTLCKCLCLFASLYGFHRFIVLIGATDKDAKKMLDDIKGWLATNDLLLADFPEVCAPFRLLKNEPRACQGQHCRGKLTYIEWGDSRIRFAKVPGSKTSGTVFEARGLTASIRGMVQDANRPSLVILDDIQTERSAYSEKQCVDRLRIINGAILNLAGVNKRISAVCPCTVIRRGDAADSLLDRRKNPHWQGQRTARVLAWPTPGGAGERLWLEYREIRAAGMAMGTGDAEATAFYIANRPEMDAELRTSWPQAFDSRTEISANQAAINLLMRDEVSFWSEHQNEPLTDKVGDGAITPESIARKITPTPEGVVPRGMTGITAFIDVHNSMLFCAVLAWGAGFRCHLLDYGTLPNQPGSDWTVANPATSLGEWMPEGGQEAKWFAALTAMCGAIANRKWVDESGRAVPVRRILIDAGFGTETVRRFCLESAFRNIAQPSHGKTMRGGEFAPKRGDEFGQNWRIPKDSPYRHVLFDPDSWKSFMAERIKTPLGDPGSLSLFAGRHSVLVRHLMAERPMVNDKQQVRWEADGRDNHLLDCLVGSMVAASVCGATLWAPMTTGPSARDKFVGARKAKP